MNALVLRLREQARRFNPALEAAPVAVLWMDEKREWEGIVPNIKEEPHELYSLGPYVPDGRSGPGVWLRMVADRQAGSVDAGETPILYLPGVGNRQLRTDLRGLKDHPKLAPIAELQYRGGILAPGEQQGLDAALVLREPARRPRPEDCRRSGDPGSAQGGDRQTAHAEPAGTRKTAHRPAFPRRSDERVPGRNGSALADGG